MKKLLPLLLLATLHADPLIEFKTGYYYFSDKNLRKLYDTGALDLQLSFAYPIWKNFNCYGSFERIHKEHHSHIRIEQVEITMYPISLGVQYSHPISAAVDYYFTIGPRFIIYHQKNHRSTIANRLDKNGFGGFTNTGFLFHILPHFTLDIFAEYSYRKVHYQKIEVDDLFIEMFPGRVIQIGGIAAGAGLGYLF